MPRGPAYGPTICDCGTESLVRGSKLVDGPSVSRACRFGRANRAVILSLASHGCRRADSPRA
jgi:hypothetical protein